MSEIVSDRIGMTSALEAARRGWGLSRPNPTVGAVVYRAGKEIASAYSQSIASGGAHAEVVAIDAAGEQCRGADLYVTLEPCSHHGKTPPCTDAIIAAGFRRVVIGIQDPHPVVDGRGIARLREAGIEVSTEGLDGAIEELYLGFSKWIITGLPYITLKLAQSADGVIARFDGSPLSITGEETRRWVHDLRALCDGIVVSSRTARNDLPRLDLRAASWLPPRFPARIVMGRRIDLSPASPLFTGEGGKTVLFGKEFSSALPRGPEQVFVNGTDIVESFRQLIDEWGKRGAHQLFVETGGEWISSLLKARLFDRLILLESPDRLGEGLGWEPGRSQLSQELQIVRFAPIGRDRFWEFRPI